MAATARLILSPLSLARNSTQSFGNRHVSYQSPSFPAISFPQSSPTPFRSCSLDPIHKSYFSCAAGGNGSDKTGKGNSGGGGGSGSGGNEENSDDSSWVGPIGAFLNGWRSRVAVDPQFPFKVLMEELVGITVCVLGDMVSRPNFGLNEQL